jgi:hypothetical protein
MPYSGSRLQQGGESTSLQQLTAGSALQPPGVSHDDRRKPLEIGEELAGNPMARRGMNPELPRDQETTRW